LVFTENLLKACYRVNIVLWLYRYNRSWIHYIVLEALVRFASHCLTISISFRTKFDKLEYLSVVLSYYIGVCCFLFWISLTCFSLFCFCFCFVFLQVVPWATSPTLKLFSLDLSTYFTYFVSSVSSKFCGYF
jgi:hypothetical protein